jgi:hypothetical protein
MKTQLSYKPCSKTFINVILDELVASLRSNRNLEQ